MGGELVARFLLVAALGALGSPWMFGFPNDLPTTKARRGQNESEEDVSYGEHLLFSDGNELLRSY